MCHGKIRGLTFFRCFRHVARRWTFRRTELILRRYEVHHYRLFLLRIPLLIFKIPLITLHSLSSESENLTHTHTLPPQNIRTRFLRGHFFFFIILFFYSFFTLFFFFLIKYTTTVSNEMELDNVIYLRMSFHYRKNLR